MPRVARVVVPDHPHHIIQRGNRNQPVFFSDQDRTFYINLLIKHAVTAGIDFWAYCLMDNHVHFIAVPKHENSFAKGIGEAHKRYTWFVNLREGWSGYLWQGRFISYPMDERYLFTAVRYVERNPVRAGMAKKAQDYPWSSARAHVYKTQDPLLSDNFLHSEIRDWAAYLAEEDTSSDMLLFKQHTGTGRPLGDENFLTKLETITGKYLRKKQSGRKKKEAAIIKK